MQIPLKFYFLPNLYISNFTLLFNPSSDCLPSHSLILSSIQAKNEANELANRMINVIEWSQLYSETDIDVAWELWQSTYYIYKGVKTFPLNVEGCRDGSTKK